jgi:hypothetical protein
MIKRYGPYLAGIAILLVLAERDLYILLYCGNAALLAGGYKLAVRFPISLRWGPIDGTIALAELWAGFIIFGGVAAISYI